MPAVPELVAALQRELGDVRADAYTRHLYASDASMYAIEPLAVAFPRSADDVAAAISVAARLGVAVVTRGAGTSLAGQAVGAGALVLDTSRHMDAIGAIDPDELRVSVGPGVVQADLNRAAAPHGLGFGPDTATADRATLGGMIANNSSGSHSILYGCTVDHVHALDVVLSDGSQARLEPVDAAERARRAAAATLEGALYRGVPEIVHAHARAIAEDYPRHWRQAGGYRLDRLGEPLNLARLIAGSEGTLAVITRATLGLVALPRARAFAVGHFASLDAAIAATGDALALEPAAVELIDRRILDLSRSKLEYRRLAARLRGDPEALLFVTFFGDDASVAARLDELEARWERHRHGYHTLRATTAAEQAALTTVRRAGLGLLMASSEGRRRPAAFIEDTAVAPERLGEYVRRLRAILGRHGLEAGFYGHCSVGCLHVRPFVDLSLPQEVRTMRAVAEEVVELVAEFGGVNSSEHGDGRARGEFNRRVFGDELYSAMRAVKALFDPAGRLNPGVMIDAPPMTRDLRDAAAPAPRPLVTTLAFGPGGMHAAADRCQRIGACRKTGTGVMCPSYMATREEEHATRGRANALVKALSSPDPAAALGDERLHAILDLCLECKACKSECPLSVDMASLKAEFLSHYQAAHGVPLRSRLFGAIRPLNRLGAATAPLSNLPGGFAPARALLERVAGIDRRRPLPRFERPLRAPVPRGASSPPAPRRDSSPPAPRRDSSPPAPRRDSSTPAPRGDVVFLADSFTTYTETAVPRAAIELLAAAGWNVRLERAGCCGRSSLSKGLLDQARGMAAAMVERLAPAAEAGIPIVGVEPSCVLTLRDEHVALLGGDPRAQTVADRAQLVEALLVEAIDDGALRLRDDGRARRILFHGHCHQKALVGTASTVALLQRIPGAEVIELDAGCCGMAGSFGFEAEHYDLSMRIGGMRLFPAVRREPAETLIAATGVSCRQQIAHGTGRHARHPVQLVRDLLV